MNGTGFGTPTGRPHDLSTASVSAQDETTIDGRAYYEITLTGCACGMGSLVALRAEPSVEQHIAIANALRASHT